MSASKLEAWVAVRGNPSKMNDADGDIDGAVLGICEKETASRDGVFVVSAVVAVADDFFIDASQPLDLSSADMRSSIIESGTRLPD